MMMLASSPLARVTGDQPDATCRRKNAVSDAVRLIGSLGLLGLLLPSGASADVCGEVQREIDALAETTEPVVLITLGPHYGSSAIDALLETARTGPPEAARGAYLALGLSRLAPALRAIRATPPPKGGDALSWSLAMLALGDAAGTGTISRALLSEPLSTRRMTAEALAKMPQKRPRTILYQGLTDEDPQVRLTAAEVHVRHYSRRARRVLVEMLSSPVEAYRIRAARALAEQRHRFRPEELSALPAPVVGPAFVANAARRGRIAKLARVQLNSSKAEARGAALAALVAIGAESPAAVARWEKRTKARFGPDVSGQAAMASALLGTAGVEALDALEPELVPAAAAVLWAFTGAGPPRNRLEPDHAHLLARVVERWIVQGFLDDARQAQVLSAMAAADPLAGLSLARARVLGPEGAALEAALEVMARTAAERDVPALMAAARRAKDPALRAQAWRAASEVCRR